MIEIQKHYSKIIFAFGHFDGEHYQKQVKHLL